MDVTLPRVLPAGIPGIPGVSGVGQAPGIAGVGAAGLPGGEGVAPAQGAMESFATLLSQAMQDVNTLQHTADGEVARLVSGEQVDIHQVMISMEKANMAFGLTLQVRNKLVEAYQEVMRMQV